MSDPTNCVPMKARVFRQFELPCTGYPLNDWETELNATSVCLQALLDLPLAARKRVADAVKRQVDEATV